MVAVFGLVLRALNARIFTLHNKLCTNLTYDERLATSFDLAQTMYERYTYLENLTKS